MGQETAVQVLRASVRQGRYESSYLLSGPSGVGKTTIGRVFARAILCESPVDGNPCGTCQSCKDFDNDCNYNYSELDAATNGGKEDMVRLRDEALYKSVGKKKILLLDESHNVSKQGYDALLKQLEQCPDHLIYIFCTTEPDKMSETIRNRCIEFQVSRLSSSQVSSRLVHICQQEKYPYQEQALTLIVQKADGHMRNAINLLAEATYLGEITVDSVKSIVRDFSGDVLQLIENLGRDLGVSLDACERIILKSSTHQLYGAMISMLSDAAKILYGYEGLSGEKQEHAQRLRDIHGFKILEFMNYLISRDRWIDRVGLKSDIILLHYKFLSDSFKPQVTIPKKEEQPSARSSETQKTSKPENEVSLTSSKLAKMSPVERTPLLRELHKSSRQTQNQDPKWAPTEWPLPKEGRIGESSFSDSELSPEEFSLRLVGGRRESM